MLSILALLCLICAAGLLLALAVIDLRTFLLPNKLVLPFALLGPAFHAATQFTYLDPAQIAAGGLVGYGLPFAIRLLANAWYKQDALGLGDVKLLGAAGLWLGPEGVLLALTAGAFAGLVHGIIYAILKAVRTKQKISLHRLVIPAGPGFIAGIVLVAAWQFRDFRPF